MSYYNVKTIGYITLLAGTSNVMTKSMTTVQIFIEKVIKLQLKGHMLKQNLTLMIISY